METDRSGLVADYAGQTATKVNQRVDEALDGILFIDEAYSLVSGQDEDAFGNEAVQTLLKRMDDQRHRLVVILAGYPAEMQRLLRTNLHEQRDEHFGNGRLVRNLFEDAVRRLANRIVGMVPMTKELLSELQPDDFRVPGIAEELLRDRSDSLRLAIVCPGCQAIHTVSHDWLGRKARCQACRHPFVVQWGDPIWPKTRSTD